MNLLQDMYVYSSEKDAYRTAFKFADVTGMGYLPFEKARAALTTAGIHADASKVRIKTETQHPNTLAYFGKFSSPVPVPVPVCVCTVFCDYDCDYGDGEEDKGR